MLVFIYEGYIGEHTGVSGRLLAVGLLECSQGAWTVDPDNIYLC